MIISAGRGNQPSLPGSTSGCAPDHMSNDRFYQCLSGPKWFLNFTDFGHSDVMDTSYRIIFNLIGCTTCPLQQQPCSYADYIQDTANAMANFTKGILNGVNGLESLDFLSNPQPYFESRVTIKSTVQSIHPSNGFCQSLP